ncbi:hypothetical protein ABIE65_003342 [Constrictibacter sp. MBR-5]|jgi:hypothetical protein|uniref:LysM domain-containing protein n=1 Tax=Constrictibacter sp. MBR-5 TaxID=3156467 RepID=UPI0033989827
MFFRGSRYEGVPEAELATADGRTIRYKRIRFIPDTGGTTAGTVPYRVQPDDRPDLVAYKTAGDPELFWRLCDANRVMRPDELTDEPGSLIRIPAPGS